MAQNTDFGMATVIRGGISTRFAERTNRILVSEMKLDKGKTATSATRVEVASMRVPRRRVFEDQLQFVARQEKEQRIVEDIGAFMVFLRAVVQRLYMKRISALLAGDFNSKVANETFWWLDDVF